MWTQKDLDAISSWIGPGLRQIRVRETLKGGYHVFISKPRAVTGAVLPVDNGRGVK